MENLKSMTDEQLVRLYASQNNEAFDVLLDRYKDRLYSYILYSIQNTDLADDIFQETFIKAIVQIRNSRYTETGKFYPWLTRIAHNLIIDQYRQERNEKNISNDESEVDLYNNINLSDADIESNMICEQTLEDVKRLVDFLPDNQKAVVEMRYYQDLSFKEISDLTGVSINTALGRMRYAIINMRRMAAESNLYL